MSERIEQLLERQNELLERIVNTLDEQQTDIKEIVKLKYLLVVSQTNRAPIPDSAWNYVKEKIVENFV